MKLVMIIAKIIQPATLLVEYALMVVRTDILEHSVTIVRHIFLLCSDFFTLINSLVDNE